MTSARRIAFRMRLRPGAAAEYRRRHDALWPEVATLLKRAGVSDYSIHLDDEDGVSLFAVLTVGDPSAYDALAQEPIMRRWWDHMEDLMETDATKRPLTWPMTRVFHLA